MCEEIIASVSIVLGRGKTVASVSDAVILAGGIGSRMLPANLFTAKEAMPLVDTPILNHLIWEAIKSGVSRIHIVLSRRKMAFLEEFFERGTIYSEGVREDLPRHSIFLGFDGVELIPHVQDKSRGVADAISVVSDHVHGPFLVLLGDMLILDRHLGPKHAGPEDASPASLQLVNHFEKSGTPCVGVYPVNSDRISNYGVVEFDGMEVSDIIEKPSKDKAPSEYILCGRYLFPENTFRILQEYPVASFGEMQSIFLLKHLISNSGLSAIKFENMDMYDSGEPVSWLKSQIDHALKRDDIGEEISNWIRRRVP